MASPSITPAEETPLGRAVRQGSLVAPASNDVSPGLLRFGDFEMDLQTGALHRNGIRVDIRAQPLEMLRVFLERPGEIITQEEFRRLLWAPDVHLNFGQSVYTAVKALREVLGDSASRPRYIETRARRGYRFIAPVIAWQHNGNEPRVHPAGELPSAVNSFPRWLRGCLCIPRGWIVFLLLVTLVGLWALLGR